MFSQSALSSLFDRVLKTPLVSEKSEKELSALSRNLTFNLQKYKQSGSGHCEMSVAYLGPCQKSMPKLLRKQYTVKSFIIDILQGYKYASGLWMSKKTHFLEILKYNK